MKTTLEITIETHQAFSKSVGGNYQNAVTMLESAMKGDNLHSDIALIVEKHFDNAKLVGGNFEEFLTILRNFIQ